MCIDVNGERGEESERTKEKDNERHRNGILVVRTRHRVESQRKRNRRGGSRNRDKLKRGEQEGALGQPKQARNWRRDLRSLPLPLASLAKVTMTNSSVRLRGLR